jgi:hypothetical protein
LRSTRRASAFLDLVLDAVQVEQRPLAGVVLEQGRDGRRVLGGKLVSRLTKFSRESMTMRGSFGIDEVAQHPLRQRQFLIEQRGRCGGGRLGLDVAPGLAQVLDVLGQFGFAGALGHGAHDEAARFVRAPA